MLVSYSSSVILGSKCTYPRILCLAHVKSRLACHRGRLYLDVIIWSPSIPFVRQITLHEQVLGEDTFDVVVENVGRLWELPLR